MTKYQVTWKTYQPKRYKVWGVAVVLALTLPTLLLANDARLGVESKHILERAAEPNSLEDTAGLLLENEVATSGEADLPRFDNRVEAGTASLPSKASWYDYDLNRKNQKCRTDDCYSMFNDTCASRDYPRGATLLVRAVESGRIVSCRVNDWVENPDVVLDLSSHAFKQLTPLSVGILEVEIVSSPSL